MVHERSALNLGLMVVAAALISVSFALPWWSYEHSTGRRIPENAFSDPGDDGVIATDWQARPGSGEGTQQPQDPDGVRASLARIEWSLLAALALVALSALSEVPGVDRVLVRRVTLACDAVAFLAITWALVDAWFLLPDAFGNGADRAFASGLDDAGYTMTRIRLGWGAAALALAPVFGGWLAKYQAGAPDPTVVAELYAQGEL